MTDRYFVDTNVLVYARDSSELHKHALAVEWIHTLWSQGSGRLSFQVLQEYYQVVTRRLSPGLDPEMARADVRDLLTWQPVRIDSAVLEAAWLIEKRFGLSWWDALIVGAAGVAECHYLLSKDLQHGQVMNDIIVLNPFETDRPS